MYNADVSQMKTRAIIRHEKGGGIASTGAQLNHLISITFHACLQRLLKPEGSRC